MNSATQVTNDFYSSVELNKLVVDYPVKVFGWVVNQNKNHSYLYYEPAFGLNDPLLTLQDPWNRSIRPWLYYNDDNPTIWQNRKSKHPSRNSMFHPHAPKKASHYAYTSINNKWMILYV